jgi:glycolate oxidase FAD binding subunit
MMFESEAEIAEAVKSAKGPLRIIGGGTRSIGRPVTGEALPVSGLTGITLYEPGALTLVAKAGTPLAEIEATLAGENQRLAFEPIDYRPLLGTEGTPTIGGAIAANASGPRRIAVGAARDHMLGVRYVDGTGNVIKNGGRVMKNVTGYDLVKLMTGSWGTLGVLTEISIKVLPAVDFEASLILHGLTTEDAVRAMSDALGSPFEVTGAAHMALADDLPSTMLRLEGFENSVRYRLSALKDRLAKFGDMSDVEGEPSRAAWRRIRDAEMFAGWSGDVWRVSTRPSDGPALIGRMGKECHTMLDWGGGLIWVLAPDGTDLRKTLGSFSGHATLIRASDTTRIALPVFHPEPAPVAQLSAGLRAKFDPKGILNPGLMGG